MDRLLKRAVRLTRAGYPVPVDVLARLEAAGVLVCDIERLVDVEA